MKRKFLPEGNMVNKIEAGRLAFIRVTAGLSFCPKFISFAALRTTETVEQIRNGP